MRKYILQRFNAHLGMILSTALVLFLIGLMLTVCFWSNRLSAYVKENMSVSVELAQEVSDKQTEKLVGLFAALPAVKSAICVSKEQAAEDLAERLGKNPVDYLGYNPLPVSLEIRLNADYANPDSLRTLEMTLKNRKEVATVSYPRTELETANRNIARILWMMLLICGILFFIAVVLINNTVRLNIYANRFLFNTMKLVGATQGFIMRPIVREQIINGIIAAGVAIAALGYVQYYCYRLFGGSVAMVTLGIAFAVLLTGVVITGVAAYVAAAKYLRLKTNELYKI